MTFNPDGVSNANLRIIGIDPATARDLLRQPPGQEIRLASDLPMPTPYGGIVGAPVAPLVPGWMALTPYRLDRHMPRGLEEAIDRQIEASERG